MLNALLWSALVNPALTTVDALRQLGAATAGKTAQAVIVLMVLGAVGSIDALGALHLLAQQAKRPTPRERALAMALHLERRLGISADEAAERFIPTYGLSAQG